MASKQVGQFEIKDGTLYGPAQYMAEWGNNRLARLLSGNDEVMSRTLVHQPDVEMAILVLMQTDYAGWKGHKQMERWLSR